MQQNYWTFNVNDNLLEKKTVKKVSNHIKLFNYNLKIISLNETARTAIDAAKSLGVEVGAIVKSLVFKSLNKEFHYLCLTSGDKFLSLNKLSLIVNDKVNKASANEVKEWTGYSIGGVPPVAHKSPPSDIFIDKNLQKHNKIFAAAGHPYAIFGLSFNDLIKMTNGKVVDIVE